MPLSVHQKLLSPDDMTSTSLSSHVVTDLPIPGADNEILSLPDSEVVASDITPPLPLPLHCDACLITPPSHNIDVLMCVPD